MEEVKFLFMRAVYILGSLLRFSRSPFISLRLSAAGYRSTVLPNPGVILPLTANEAAIHFLTTRQADSQGILLPWVSASKR